MTQSLWPQSTQWCEITLGTPAENLALDEVLLQDVDRDSTRATLRTWESSARFVVVGRSNHVDTETDLQQCLAEDVPIFRRASGGGAVVLGAGCLAYALALPLTDELRAMGVTTVTRSIMQTIADSLAPLATGVTVCGTSDLVLNDRKFSGNSQRWLKQAFLHHGTILYDFDLPALPRLLKQPTRQPEYRLQRTHQDFVTNIPLKRQQIVDCLVNAWRGQPATYSDSTLQQARQLAQSRYEQDQWNLER